MDIVLDCSVIFGFVFADEKNDYTQKIRHFMLSHKAVVPSIFPVEVTNVLNVSVKRGRYTADEARQFLNMLMQLPIQVEHTTMPDMHKVLEYSILYQLSSYDASYLTLADHYSLPLATQDKALQKAAAKKQLLFA